MVIFTESLRFTKAMHWRVYDRQSQGYFLYSRGVRLKSPSTSTEAYCAPNYNRVTKISNLVFSWYVCFSTYKKIITKFYIHTKNHFHPVFQLMCTDASNPPDSLLFLDLCLYTHYPLKVYGVYGVVCSGPLEYHSVLSGPTNLYQNILKQNS